MVPSTQRDEFIRLVGRDLAAVSKALASYRRQYRLMAIGGVVSGGIATALTGGVAAGGPELADAVGGWRLVCFAAALAAAAATCLAGIQERLRTPEHVANASACAAQLTALQFSLRTGTADLQEHREEYTQLLETYSAYMVSA